MTGAFRAGRAPQPIALGRRGGPHGCCPLPRSLTPSEARVPCGLPGRPGAQPGESMNRIIGKTAVITGASSGIGKHVRVPSLNGARTSFSWPEDRTA